MHEAAPLRYGIDARRRLDRDSDLMLDQVRTIDNRRFNGDALAELDASELRTMTQYLQIVFGFQD